MEKRIEIQSSPLAGAAFDLGGFDRVDELCGSWTDAHANFLSSLSDEETADLLRCSSRRALASRAQLFGAGDRSNDVYIVAEGCVRLYQVSPSGKETILWFSFPGEIFGIAELCSGGEREIYAEANEASEVHAIKHTDFAAFLSRHPEAAMRAIGILSARVRTIGHELVGLATDNVETRIARLLMRFAAVSSGASRCNGADGELCIKVRLTHQDIANQIGASRQTVTSILMQLRRRGVVRTVDRHIHITQPDQLRRLVEAGAV